MPAEKVHLDITLQPKQEALLRLIAAKGKDAATNIGFGGARGGSKSHGIRCCALGMALSEKGIGIGIFRRLSAELKKNHIDAFFEQWPALLECWHATDKQIVLPKVWGGSRISFISAENTDELKKKFRGLEFKYLFIDQAEELTEEELIRAKTSNRWPGVQMSDCKTIYTFNPGGPGTEYLRRIFFLQKYQGRERAGNYAFIHSYGWDNFEWFRGVTDPEGKFYSYDAFYTLTDEERFQLFVSETDYGREMNALPESLRMGELLGRFDAFAGQYFAGVWDEAKCVIGMNEAEQMIQPWWTRWTSTDWGFAHHTVHLWFASGKLGPREVKHFFGAETEYPVDVVIVYRELVLTETAEKDCAMRIVEMTPVFERRHIQREFMDPSCFSKKGSADLVSDQFGEVFRRHGLPGPERADNSRTDRADRIGGWRSVYNGFRQTTALRGADIHIEKERAREGPMFLISANCPEVIGAVPLLMRDPKDLEDALKTSTMADDALDSLRYGFYSMLDARSKAPVAVRAREAWDAAPGDNTQKALTMRKFEHREREKRLPHRRWRVH